ncbi:winged helix-turn-helix transcriptional regulator [Nocardioides ginsengisoli]|uniref:Winged helix-turn-helix transcriptional regulator n=1 Tax=Nocardioides ginsengisoli TaxID=363868 RepID=A0ABW3W5A1_9ACTN
MTEVAGYDEVSTAVRLLGDRWSLLIVREMWAGNNRFTEIVEALPGLSRSLLSSRLRYLERHGIVERRDSADEDRRRKQHYALTEIGAGLAPSLRALGEWATIWDAHFRGDDAHLALDVVDAMKENIEVTALPRDRMIIQLFLADTAEGAAYLRASRGLIRGRLGHAEENPDLVVRTTPATLSALHWGHISCAQAISRRDIVFEGPTANIRAFPDWFPNRPALTAHRRDA